MVDAHARTPRNNFPPLVWHYTLRAEALQTELFALKSEKRNVQSIWPNIDFTYDTGSSNVFFSLSAII